MWTYGATGARQPAPLIGTRYRRLDHPDYDLCERCYQQHLHDTPSEGQWLFEPITVSGDPAGEERSNEGDDISDSDSSC